MATPAPWPQHWIDHDLKVKPYVWANRLLGWLGSGVGLAWLAFLLLTGKAEWLETWATAHSNYPLAAWYLYFGALGLSYKILLTPVSLGHYFIEKNYGLSKQSLLSWLADQFKGTLLAVGLGAITLAVAYATVVNFRESWWWILSLFLIFFSVVLAQLAPVLLIPLFFKMEPMEESPLKARLRALCDRFKIEVKEIYHLGLGEKTEKGNAAFVGLGKTKRIIIGDTLYKKFDPAEVEAVFAHELGHQVHWDMVTGLAIGALSLLLGFWVAHWAVSYFHGYLATDVTRPFGFLQFLVVLSVVQIPLGWAQAIYSRAREWAADNFASEKLGLGKPLGDALERLTLQNWGLFKPNAIVEFFTHSHPAPGRRISKLRSANSD